jgi:hypothetical protein
MTTGSVSSGSGIKITKWKWALTAPGAGSRSRTSGSEVSAFSFYSWYILFSARRQLLFALLLRVLAISLQLPDY